MRAVGCPAPVGRQRGGGVIRRCGSVLVFAFLALFAAGAAHAAEVDAPFRVDADEVEYQAERDLYVARGNVVLTQEGNTLRADRVYFSNQTRLGVASGDVVEENAEEAAQDQRRERDPGRRLRRDQAGRRRRRTISHGR